MKAPTWVADDGTVPLDSTLILDYPERFACTMLPEFAPVDRHLALSAPADRAKATANLKAATLA